MKTILATIFGVTALATPALAATGAHLPGTVAKLPVDMSTPAFVASATAAEPVLPATLSKTKAPGTI